MDGLRHSVCLLMKSKTQSAVNSLLKKERSTHENFNYLQSRHKFVCKLETLPIGLILSEFCVCEILTCSYVRSHCAISREHPTRKC